MEYEVGQMIPERGLFPHKIIGHERQRDKRPVILALMSIWIEEKRMGKEARQVPHVLYQRVLQDEKMVVPQERVTEYIGIHRQCAQRQNQQETLIRQYGVLGKKNPFRHTAAVSLLRRRIKSCGIRKKLNGEGEIRTLVGLRPTAFRERPVMTTSVPLHKNPIINIRDFWGCRGLDKPRRQKIYYLYIDYYTTNPAELKLCSDIMQ